MDNVRDNSDDDSSEGLPSKEDQTELKSASATQNQEATAHVSGTHTTTTAPEEHACTYV